MAEGARVLVVEDDEGTGHAWNWVLEREGHVVDVARSLAKARSLLREAVAQHRPYQVVLLDLGLPDGDGAELLDELEATEPRPGVGVVSGKLDSERALALWGRCVVDLPKPLRRNTMVELVERLVRERAAASSVDRFCADHELSRNETLLVKRSTEGKSVREIAGELGCAVGSVKTLWKRVHHKTGLRTRRQVVSAAWSYRGSKA